MGPVTLTDDEQTLTEGGVSYAVRLGFGLTRRWLLMLGLEGMSFVGENSEGQDVGISHRLWMLGAQVFPIERLYLRAGFGLAVVSDDLSNESDSGPGVLGGIGFEFVQTNNVALALEWASTVSNIRNRSFQRDELWWVNGVNLAVSFY
jgi:hypothetical protein